MKSHDLVRSLELVRQREPMIEYYIEHAHDKFYIFTNIGTDREYKASITKIYLSACLFVCLSVCLCLVNGG